MNSFLLDSPVFVKRYTLGVDHANQLRGSGHDLVLVSSGRRFLQVARAEGLLTFNPETQTQAELDVLLRP